MDCKVASSDGRSELIHPTQQIVHPSHSICQLTAVDRPMSGLREPVPTMLTTREASKLSSLVPGQHVPG